MHKFSLEKKPSEMGWTLGVTKLVSWLWLATDSPVYLQIRECLEQKAPSVACHYAEATQITSSPRCDDSGHCSLFPKRQGEGAEHMARDRISVLCRACHHIPPHLDCPARGKVKGKGEINTQAGYRGGGRRIKPTWVQRGRMLDITAGTMVEICDGPHEDEKSC